MNTKAYRVKGSTTDVTSCELCGREDLRGTIALEILDAEGNGTGEIVHYGSDCGAKAAGWTQADMRKRTTAADRAAVEAERVRQDAEHAAFMAAYSAWLQEHYGVSAPSDLCKLPGRPSGVKVLREYRESVAA